MSILAAMLKLLVIWIIGAALLAWGRLPAVWRWRLALVASATGVVFLVLGMNSEGLRDAPTMSVVLLGQPYVTGHVSASASLPYYLVSAVCLLLGSLGLAVGDDLAALLRQRWFLTAVGVSVLVTALRFLLEKVAAPAAWTQAVGIVWLAPLVGAYFSLSLREEGQGTGALLRALVAYAFSIRGTVAALMLVATLLQLGSHYDLSPLVRVSIPWSRRVREFEAGSASQILNLGIVPQLVVWTCYTVVAGLLGAALGRVLLHRGGPPPVPQPRGASPIHAEPDGSRAA